MGTTAWNNKGKKQKLSFTTKPINLRNPGPPPPYDPSLAWQVFSKSSVGTSTPSCMKFKSSWAMANHGTFCWSMIHYGEWIRRRKPLNYMWVLQVQVLHEMFLDQDLIQIHAFQVWNIRILQILQGTGSYLHVRSTSRVPPSACHQWGNHLWGACRWGISGTKTCFKILRNQSLRRQGMVPGEKLGIIKHKTCGVLMQVDPLVFPFWAPCCANLNICSSSQILDNVQPQTWALNP